MTMASKEIIQKRLIFHQEAYEKLQAAYLALLEGGVKSYTIGDRTMTKFDIAKLQDEIREEERLIDELTAALDGGRARKAFGVIPRDW